MKLKQLSIFLENAPGRLYEATHALGEAGINLRSLCISDSADFESCGSSCPTWRRPEGSSWKNRCRPASTTSSRWRSTTPRFPGPDPLPVQGKEGERRIHVRPGGRLVREGGDGLPVQRQRQGDRNPASEQDPDPRCRGVRNDRQQVADGKEQLSAEAVRGRRRRPGRRDRRRLPLEGGYDVTLCDVVPSLLEPALDPGILIEGTDTLQAKVARTTTRVDDLIGDPPDVVIVAVKATALPLIASTLEGSPPRGGTSSAGRTASTPSGSSRNTWAPNSSCGPSSISAAFRWGRPTSGSPSTIVPTTSRSSTPGRRPPPSGSPKSSPHAGSTPCTPTRSSTWSGARRS